MTNQLDNILISYKHPDFEKRITEPRLKVILASRFTAGDERNVQLNEIFSEISKRGNVAVAEFTEKLDGVKLTPEQFRVVKQDLEKAHKQINPELLKSLQQAIDNVKKYQSEIFIGNFKHPGIKYRPIKRVGICVPGASAPLPSTVIMTAVPAQVAGVKEIAVVSPPRYKGSIHPTILAVCYELGIYEVYRIGGAQAVAALVYGEKPIEKVDKIVGPGNQWVQMAKKHFFGFIDIDSIAGPSEVLIIANDKANPSWIAADMLSQTEHAPGSAMMFTVTQQLAEKVLAELEGLIQVEEPILSGNADRP